MLMATYKVIQDIEAEDKLIGPLSLRQFIYAIIMLAILFVGYTFGTILIFLAIPFIFPAVLFGFLASPFGHDQPSEVWLLAKIQFILKPRVRIWDQNGIKDLVNITVPKKIVHFYSSGMSQTEVKSRLHALASTMDSRGWAAKDANINIFSPPSYLARQEDSDRLINPASLARDVPMLNDTTIVDVLDEQSSTTAQNFGHLISASKEKHRQEAINKMNSSKTEPSSASTSQATNNWFANTAPAGNPLPTADSSVVNEESFLDRLHEEQSLPAPPISHIYRSNPLKSQANLSQNQQLNTPPNKAQAISTATPNPAIIGLVNNNDLNVATIAREINKINEQPSGEEVVIPLR